MKKNIESYVAAVEYVLSLTYQIVKIEKRSTSILLYLPTYPHTCEVLLESDKGSFLISILPAAKMACGNVLDIAAATDACPTFTLWCVWYQVHFLFAPSFPIVR